MAVSDSQKTGQSELEAAIAKANSSVGKLSGAGLVIISPGVRGEYLQLPATTPTSGAEPRGVPSGVASLGGSNTKGFTPLGLINPTRNTSSSPDLLSSAIGLGTGEYKYYDWTGQRIEKRIGIDNLAKNMEFLDTEERFELSKDMPKNDQQLKKTPYSTRDIYAIFNDKTTDYFRHGLQAVYGVSPVVPSEFFNTNKNGKYKIDSYSGTPWENQDPVMFGFEIIIDNISSPLLNGAVDGFLANYKMINEISSKETVYQDFKNQLIKFFKTKTSVKIDQDKIRLTANGVKAPNTDGPSKIFNFGRAAYMGFYLNSIKGLEKLVESNTSEKKKFLVDYQKDIITLDFTEDVSLSVGTLAHLYKLLYWSKPNGKGLVPENLLRFNCEIIVSECRNFNRVRAAVKEKNLQVIKDNLSRYVYSLRECQFYFDKMAHDDLIDLSSIKTFEKHQITFDYKYSTVRLERFTPTGNGFGVYQGYNSGAIWKIGNPGSRDQRTNPNSATDPNVPTTDSSVPKFYTIGLNPFNENGILGSDRKPKPFIIKKFGDLENLTLKENPTTQENALPAELTNNTNQAEPEATGGSSGIDNIKTSSKEKAKSAYENTKNQAIDQASGLKDKLTDKQFYTNLLKKTADVAVAAAKQSFDRAIVDVKTLRQKLLQDTLNKIKNASGLGVPGNIYLNDGDRSKNPFPKHMPKNPLYNPPRNVYTDAAVGSNFGVSQVFYDVRGALLNFAGDTLGDALGGGNRI